MAEPIPITEAVHQEVLAKLQEASCAPFDLAAEIGLLIKDTARSPEEREAAALRARALVTIVSTTPEYEFAPWAHDVIQELNRAVVLLHGEQQ